MFIILIIVEVGLRFSGRLQTYSEKSFGVYQSPYATNADSHFYMGTPFDTVQNNTKEFSYTYYQNDFGLNDKRNLDTANTHTTTIYLGDSFTGGAGTPQDSTIPVLLSNNSNCTFVNAGFIGSDPFFECKLIDSVFLPKGFKNYIVMINASDLYDYIFRGGEERFLPNGKLQYNKAPCIEKIHKHSYIVRAFLHGILKMDFTLLPPNKMKQKKEEAVNTYTQLFVHQNKKLDGNLLVIVQPYARQYAFSNKVLSEVMNFKYLQQLYENLQENNIKTINLDAPLSKVLNNENYLNYSWEIDGHYNSKGYLLLAQTIQKELDKLNYCPQDTTMAYQN